MEKQYTPRERVITALNHQEPDRIPLDFGGNTVSSMMQGAYQSLKKHLNLNKCENESFSSDWYSMIDFDERILELFEIDTRKVYMRGGSNYQKIISEDGTWIDELGFTRRYTGMYGEILYHSLRKAKDLADINEFKFPDAYDPARVEGLKERVEYLYNNTDYAIVAGGAVCGLLETCHWLRGFDQFPIDLLTEKKLSHAILNKLTNFGIEILDAFLNIVGPYIQVIELSDDLAHQNGLIISPGLYKEMILPYYKKQIDFVKSKTKAKVFHHCCGASVLAADLLLEAGIDILNSLQPRARGMDSTYLKDTYGDRLSFHGGIDIQEVMPYGTVEDVENEVKRRIAIYGPGGGYIFAAAHCIQTDVPPENIIIMYEAGKKWGKYPLDDELLKLRETISK